MGRIAGTEIICPETLRVPLLLVGGVVCFIFYLFTWYKYSNCFSYYKLFPVSIPLFVQSCSIDKKESLLPLGSESLLPISPLRILSPRSPPPHKIPPEEEVSPLPQAVLPWDWEVVPKGDGVPGGDGGDGVPKRDGVPKGDGKGGRVPVSVRA